MEYLGRPDERHVMDGFAHHLREAMKVNGERRSVYSEITEGKSRRLSGLLIASERLLLPTAMFYDARAARFNRQGIAVVAGDFVPMEGLPAATTPPVYSERAPQEEIEDVRRDLKGLRRSVRRHARTHNYAAVGEDCARALAMLSAREERLGAHFAMVVHLVESLGFAAANAPRWAAESDDATLGLSRSLVRLQAMPLANGLVFDVMAQGLHGMGCGILVNDVPAIPFPAQHASPS